MPWVLIKLTHFWTPSFPSVWYRGSFVSLTFQGRNIVRACVLPRAPPFERLAASNANDFRRWTHNTHYGNTMNSRSISPCPLSGRGSHHAPSGLGDFTCRGGLVSSTAFRIMSGRPPALRAIRTQTPIRRSRRRRTPARQCRSSWRLCDRVRTAWILPALPDAIRFRPPLPRLCSIGMRNMGISVSCLYRTRCPCHLW